ncbi:MAG TPA: hypothetical protein EYQ84_04065 [Nitrospinaceae bacterium]|nr:hypothetical protein [Nitrospinaceae bacterium]
MKLTTKKLESLIQEMMGKRFSQEQEQKILTLIKKSRNLILDLQVVQGFFPTIVNAVYSYEKNEGMWKAIRNSVNVPQVKKAIMKHYTSVQNIANILEELNQYLVLLESLELEPGNLARTTKGLLFMGLSGPVTSGTSHSIKLDELRDMVDTGIMFLEDIESIVPGYFGDGNMGFEYMRDIADSFHNNYSDLFDYLERVT